MQHTTQIASRAYTLVEVDLMRNIEFDMRLRRIDASRYDDNQAIWLFVEERVRTNMMAGVDPVDLAVKNEEEKEDYTKQRQKTADHRAARIASMMEDGMPERDAHRYNPAVRHPYQPNE